MLLIENDLPLEAGARIAYFLYTTNDQGEKIILQVFDCEHAVKNYMSDPILSRNVYYISKLHVTHLESLDPIGFLPK